MSLTGKSLILATALCVLSSPMLALAKINIRQVPSVSVPVSNAVALKSSTSSLISTVLYPALRTILAAPIKFIQHLLADIRQFLGTHNFRDIFNINFLRKAFARMPQRLLGYWTGFVEVEMECIRRTLCDLSDYTSPRVPAWLHQILVIYFTTFSQDSVYYQALANGMINHNCPLMYAKCDPQLFMSRMSNNLTNTFNSTVAPLRDAFNQLMHVTTSTLSTIDGNTTPAPSVGANLVPPQLNGLSDIDEEDEEEDDTNRQQNDEENEIVQRQPSQNEQPGVTGQDSNNFEADSRSMSNEKPNLKLHTIADDEFEDEDEAESFNPSTTHNRLQFAPSHLRSGHLLFRQQHPQPPQHHQQ